MQVAVLDGKDSLTPVKSFRVVFSGPFTEFKEMVGAPCGKIVFPNVSDYGYAKFRLDSASNVEVKKSIGKIKDPFVRQMAWSQLLVIGCRRRDER